MYYIVDYKQQCGDVAFIVLSFCRSVYMPRVMLYWPLFVNVQ